MKQINNGYDSKYFLTKEGRLYNAETKQYKERDKKNSFYLKQIDGKYRRVSLKELYFDVYEENYCKDDIIDIEGEK